MDACSKLMFVWKVLLVKHISALGRRRLVLHAHKDFHQAPISLNGNVNFTIQTLREVKTNEQVILLIVHGVRHHIALTSGLLMSPDSSPSF